MNPWCKFFRGFVVGVWACILVQPEGIPAAVGLGALAGASLWVLDVTR